MGKPAAAQNLVPVISPEGQVGTVPAEQAEAALRQGYTLTTKEDVRQTELAGRRSGLGEMAATVGEGAARGLTFGLSDEAIRDFGGAEWRKAAAERREFMPTLAGASEVGGALAPILLSGGTGAGVKAGLSGAKIAAEGASLARTGAEAATLAREGAALARAGEAAAPSLLQSAARLAPPSLVARGGDAVAAGVRGIVGTGAESFAGRALQKALPMAAQMGAEGAVYGAGNAISEAALGDKDLTAEKLLAGAKGGALAGLGIGGALGTLGAAGGKLAEKAFKFADESSLRDWLKAFRDERTIKALGASKRDVTALGGIARSGERAEQRMGEIADTVLNRRMANGEKLFTAGSTTAELAQRTKAAADEVGAAIGALRKEAAAAADSGGMFNLVQPRASEFIQRAQSEVIAPLRQSLNIADRRVATNLERRLQPLAKRVEAGEATFDDLTKLRQSWDAELHPPKTAGGISVARPGDEHLFSMTRSLEDTVESLTDDAIAATGKPELTGKYQALKREFRDLKDANKMAEGWVQRDVGNRAVSPTDYLTGLGGAMTAATGGASAVSSAVTGGITSAVHNVVRERGSAVAAAVADRLLQTNALSHVLAGVEGAAEGSLAKMFAGAAKSATVQSAIKAPLLAGNRTVEPSDYEGVTTRLANVTSNPGQAHEMLAEHIAPIAQHAPMVASAVASQAQRTAAYLQSKMPKAPPSMSVVQRPNAQPNPVARARFERQVRGADAQAVIRRVATGHASLDEIETMRNVSPKFYEWARGKALEQYQDVIATGKDVSYDKRLAIGRFIGAPVDPTQDPSFIRRVQEGHRNKAGNSAGQTENTTAGAPKRTINLAGGMATSAQRIGRIGS